MKRDGHIAHFSTCNWVLKVLDGIYNSDRSIRVRTGFVFAVVFVLVAKDKSIKRTGPSFHNGEIRYWVELEDDVVPSDGASFDMEGPHGKLGVV
jgi:hypothetical protein